MKKLFTLFLSLFFSAFLIQAQSQTLFDYETTGTSGGFASWGGAGYAMVDNPDASGINTSAHVGEFTHDGSDGYIGIQSDGPLDNMDFTATPYFRIKVYVDKPVEIIFKLQNDPNWWESAERKYQVTDSEINQWIELAFNFSTVTATNYNRVVLYFDGAKALSSAGDKYYFDDINKSNTPPPASITYTPADATTDVPVFASVSVNSNFALRNVDDSEITDLSAIAWLKKTSPTGDDVPFTATINADKTSITISPDAMLDPSTTYYYGLNDGTVEIAATEEALNSISASFTTSDSAPAMVLYNDFETDGTSLCSVVETMGDPAPDYSLAADPANEGNQVLKFSKNDSWGGWSRVHLELDRPMDFTKGSVFTMRVYSPITTWVRLKIGNQKDDGGNFSEKDADVRLANGWQNLYFDYASANLTATDFTHISIYFGGGDATAYDFYLDNFQGPALTSGVGFEELNPANVRVYPNPASKYLYITNLEGLKLVKIYNVTGQKIREQEVLDNRIEVNNLPKGVYILSIKNQEGKTFNSKFFKR
jgi:hypothetical protein